MVKNTPILSALALSLVLVASLGSNAVAQEYITTQSAELNQAIARAEKAQQDAAAAGSVRGKQISNYIGGILEQAHRNGYANAEDLTRVLNDAAIATPLLLGTSQSTTNAGSTNRTANANTASTPSATSYTMANNEVVANSDVTAAEATMVTALADEPDSAKARVAVTPEAVAETNAGATLAKTDSTKTDVVKATTAKTAGTGVTLKVEVQPQATADQATVSSEDRVILANATVRSTINDINANTEPAEVPNTGESKNNTFGKIIATAMAAVVAMFGAVMIVKRMKKNA